MWHIFTSTNNTTTILFPRQLWELLYTYHVIKQWTEKETTSQPGSHRLNRSINPLDVNIAALRADNLDSTHRWRFITT